MRHLAFTTSEISEIVSHFATQPRIETTDDKKPRQHNHHQQQQHRQTPSTVGKEVRKLSTASCQVPGMNSWSYVALHWPRRHYCEEKHQE